MEISTQALTLSYIKYGDSSAIVRFYSEEKGFITLIWKGAFSSRNKSKYLLSPLSKVQIYFRFKENDSLSLLKKIEPDPNNSLQKISIEKNTLILFLSEILKALLQNEPYNIYLYRFILEQIEEFKKTEKTQLWIQRFLLDLTTYLGCQPHNNYQSGFSFDLESGGFSLQTPINGISLEDSLLWSEFLKEENPTFSAQERFRLLEILIDYFSFQVSSFRKPKSLEIIKEVFTT